MTVHALGNIIVEQQQEGTLCWASLTRAILLQLDMDSPDQLGLRDEFKAVSNQSADLVRGQFSIAKALKPRGIECLDERVKIESLDDKIDYVHGVGAALSASLDDGRPVVFGITTSDRPGLEKLEGGGTVAFRRALLVHSYDDVTKTVGFMDPARGDNAARAVPLGSMLSGFPYAYPADLGVKMAALVKLPRKLFCRVYQIIYPQRP